LQPSRCADADQLSHEKAKVEATDMNQQTLSNVGVAAELHATHPAGLIEMGKGSFQTLASQPQQAQASRTADAPTIAVTASRAVGFFFQFRRPRSGSAM
jgi:hypothetical protein